MALDKHSLYRFPWSMNDNPIAWLEVTDICDIKCDGCYRQQLTGHKPLEKIKEEVLFLKQWRNPDNVSIAGGEPLVHPDIVDIVAFIAENGLKPVLITNAVKLKPELLLELKKAGVAGFTIHIDSRQSRPGWEGKSEIELNTLRQQFADMIHAARGMFVFFNATVFASTLGGVPEVVLWGLSRIDRVHGMVFITYRTATSSDTVIRDGTDSEVDACKLRYVTDHCDEPMLTIPDVYQAIKDAVPLYEPASYLGGSIVHSSYKWLVGGFVGSRKRVYGALGKRTMELAQIMHHLFKGRYVSYVAKTKIGAKTFLLSPWDKVLRRAAWNWLRDVAKRPWRLLNQIHMQSLVIVQPPDLLPDGRADMCDSCPDMTVHEGKLVNSCRLDEYRLYGGLLSAKAGKSESSQQSQSDMGGGAVQPIAHNTDQHANHK